MAEGLRLNNVGEFETRLTRDEIIEAAHQQIGAIEEGNPLNAEQLANGVRLLNLIIREIDESGRWRWTVPSAVHIPIIAGVAVYDVNHGLPTNVAEVESVVYRDTTGQDSEPLTILSVADYDAIPDKLRNDTPVCVFLSEDAELSNRKLYIWPVPSSVGTSSFVTGTDGQIYRCLYPHTAATTGRPIDGPNWEMLWETGIGAPGSPSTWTAGTAYTTAEAIRLRYRRPIHSYTLATDRSDLPLQWQRVIVARLAEDLHDIYHPPTKDVLNARVKGAYSDIAHSTRTKMTNIHNKVKYF